MALSMERVTLPSALAGQKNGWLAPEILFGVPDSAPAIRLVTVAARAFVALRAACPFHIESTGIADSYRLYVQQEWLFRDRYQTGYLAGRPTKEWGGHTWYLRMGQATAAVPGTSNHGWGLALDISNCRGALLSWLENYAYLYGFSWELESEPWHIRYFPGDAVPFAVKQYEASLKPLLKGSVMPDVMILATHTTGKVYARYSNGATVHLGPTEYAYWAGAKVPQISLSASEEAAGVNNVPDRLEAARVDVPR